MSYFRDNIDAMEAYVPGEQPGDGADVVKLNTNENAYPPSPKALAVLGDFRAGRLRVYPDPMAGHFRQAVSEVLHVPAEWVLPGNGSDDLIVMIARACAGPGRAVAYPAPTFPFYRTQALIEDATIIEVPFDAAFNLPTDALIEAAGAVTLVANPNSPSGTVAGADELSRLAEGLTGVLVIDEAYVDFADTDALELVRRYENVIILRTLSKGYSLAGLRIGFGIAQPPLLAGLLKTKAIYNVDAVAAAVGAAALRDQDHKNECAEKIRASRARLSGELERLGFGVLPSQANFLLVEVPGGDAKALCNALKERGILVRYFNEPALADKLRITVGTDEENERLLTVLRELASGPSAGTVG